MSFSVLSRFFLGDLVIAEGPIANRALLKKIPGCQFKMPGEARRERGAAPSKCIEEGGIVSYFMINCQLFISIRVHIPSSLHLSPE